MVPLVLEKVHIVEVEWDRYYGFGVFFVSGIAALRAGSPTAVVTEYIEYTATITGSWCSHNVSVNTPSVLRTVSIIEVLQRFDALALLYWLRVQIRAATVDYMQNFRDGEQMLEAWALKKLERRRSWRSYFRQFLARLKWRG